MIDPMASTHINIFFFCFFLFIISHSTFAKTTSFRPKALVLPITKDPSTLQYITHVKQRTPLVSVKLTVDLGGQGLWVRCADDCNSSSYKPSRCNSAQCSLVKTQNCGGCDSSPKPGCYHNTCFIYPQNPISGWATSYQLGQDVLLIQSTDGYNPRRVVKVSNFLFSCGWTNIIDGLATGVEGMAGLGRSKISLPSQFSSAFSFRRKFTICLPSSSNGVAIFGDGPYMLLPGIDVSKFLTFTPLILNKVSLSNVAFPGDPSTEYFIGVKSIEINGNVVPLNTSLLSISKDGHGGTKISTVNPYTVMETTIYRAFIDSFSKELAGVPKVTPIAPFGLCFDGTKIGSTRVGPAVPSIDLVLQNKVKWMIFGANSMVNVKVGVSCLGVVDGGVNPWTSIVIGGHQLENNLLQIDLAASKLGFSSSLLLKQTSCANFNFTSIA